MAGYSGVQTSPFFAVPCEVMFNSDCKPELTASLSFVEDDQFVQIKSKPTNNELRGRVVDYLNSVVREKKKAEAKKKTEARMENIKGRTMRMSACITLCH